MRRHVLQSKESNMYKSHLENQQTETESCPFCTEWSSFRGKRWGKDACM